MLRTKMLLSKAEEKSQLNLETLNLKLLHIALGNTQLKEVAQGVAVNGTAQRSWDIWSYVRLADGAENEVTDFCFT